MLMVYENLEGKNVVVILRPNNYRKFGKFLRQDVVFIYIKFYSDGSENPINKLDIRAMEPDTKFDGVAT